MRLGPFSEMLHQTMTYTAATLFNQLQTAVFVYTQSDEISILLRDWDRLETQQWFGGNLQKIVSLSSSIAATAFNYLLNHVAKFVPCSTQELAQFDARAYNLPKEEVTNYFLWRQQDASRNSVNMLGRFYFSQKEMHGKSISEVQEMLWSKHQVNWDALTTWKKRGACVYQRADWSPFMSFPRGMIDDDPPIFSQDRPFVERHLSPISNGPDGPQEGARFVDVVTGLTIEWDGLQWRPVE